MKPQKKYDSHQSHKAAQRKAFMEAGGYDGRFRSKTVPSGKQYSRKEKHRRAYLGGQD
jgi:hypothetical protein